MSKIGRVLNSPNQSKNKIKAFTLAEVLITLAIIGVVAALTIPTLVTSYQKKMYVTQLKKSYNNLTNGFKTLMANEGVTNLEDTTLWSFIEENGRITSENVNSEEVKPFFDEFKKTFKVAAAYDTGKLPEQQRVAYKTLSGNEGDEINSGIFLADGSHLYFDFQRPAGRGFCGTEECKSLADMQEKRGSQSKFWSWVGFLIIDVNGLKGPNIYGRDVFVYIVGNDGTLYPFGGKEHAMLECPDKAYSEIEGCNHYWKQNNYNDCDPSSGYGEGCAARIMEENWSMNY